MQALPYPVILSSTGVGLILIAVIVWMVSSSVISALVIIALAGVIGYILFNMSTVKVTQKKGETNITVDPIPGPQNPTTQAGMGLKEVFHISDNAYTFEEAPAVCGAYGAELATYDQLTEALTQGAEWCGYGWSAMGMALYPTQQATWEAMQRNPGEEARTACGHPGVNGGYFDPRMKFGVNCYGRKPGNPGTKLPKPVPGTDEEGFNKAVNKFKAMLSSINLSPFNRSIWSKGGFFGSADSPGPAPMKTPEISAAPINERGVPMETPSNASAPMEPSPSNASAPANTGTFSEQLQTTYDDLCKTFGICPSTNNSGGASSRTEEIKKNIEANDPSERRRLILEEASRAGVAPPPDNATNAEVAEWRTKNKIST
jgi:hypothetical protein